MAKRGKWLAGSLALLLGMAAGYWSLRNGESATLETHASDTALPSTATSEQGEPPALGVASHAPPPERRPQPRLRSEQPGTAVGARPTAAHRTISPPAAGPTEQQVAEPAVLVTLPLGTERWRYGDTDGPALSSHDFRGTNLEYVDLSNADLGAANFKDADLAFADLRGANLEGAVFDGTVLQSADLRRAVLRDATIEPPVGFGAADLRGADLRNADFSCRTCAAQSDGGVSTFTFAHLNEADLRGVNFGRTIFLGSVFDGADLRGADLSDTVWSAWPATINSLRGALYDRHTRLPVPRPCPPNSTCEFDPEDWGMIYVPEED